MLGVGAVCVQLRLSNTKDCFLHLASQRASQLHLEECQAIEISWGLQQSAFLSWVERRYTGFEGENIAEVNRQLGEKLGLQNGEQVFLRPCAQVSSCQQAVVEPLSPSDWEILELHSTSLERHIMDQIRIVFPGGIFPIWVGKHTVIYIEVGSLMPAAAYGRLEPFTELIVSPKLRQIEGSSFVGNSILNKELNLGSNKIHNENLEKPRIEHPSKGPHNQHRMNEKHVTENQDFFNRSFMSNLWHMIKNLLLVNSDVPEQLSSKAVCKDTFLNTISMSFEIDSTFRVCKRFPYNLEIYSSVPWNQRQPDTVHIFPWHQDMLTLDNSDTQIIYGKLTKLLSCRQQKEISKQNLQTEKKNIVRVGSDTKTGVSEAEDESCIIKIICHGCEHLKCTKSAGFHSGKVWPQDIKEDDIKSSFLSWLNVVSSEELPYFATLSNLVQIPIAEREIEFMLFVEQLVAKSKIEGNVCFLLYSHLVKEISIEVVMHPATVDSNVVKTVDDIDQILPYYKLNCLGGVRELAVSTFEHISLSLLGHPLSWEIASIAQGLRSGGVLLTGVKGSGKTTLAKAICREASDKLEAHVEIIDCKTLRGKRAENIRKKWEDAFTEAAWRQPSIVLLDDLDHIAGAVSTPEHEHSAEAILSKQLSQILKNLIAVAVSQATLIALIATSISEYTLHPSLVCAEGSHIFQCIQDISLPNQDQRVQLLTSVIQNKIIIPLETLQNIDLQGLAKATEGFVARDFVILMERAMHSHVLTSKNIREQELHLTTLDFQRALEGFTPTSLRNAKLNKPKDLGWDKVGGLHEVKQILTDTIQLSVKYPQLFIKLPIRQRSGILLYGAPGTGKTLLAGVITRESGLNFISIKGPELLSKYIGASEQAIRDVFSKAQAAKPCILFFDEFDSIAPRRGHDNTGVTDRVVNQLLTQLDGVEGLQGVYVLAATSRPDLIDPALLRPGRLDKSVYCPPPDQVARYEILKALSQSLPLADDVDFQQIATMTEYFTGADLKALLYNAQLDAVHNTLSSSVFRDAGSGSDSDMSLSSMIFLNHSNGSDESVGDVERWSEHSPVYLDTSEILPDDPCPNIWRLYFGSSCESELGTGTSSEQNSQCLSGPNSMTLDHMITSVRDTISSHPPAYMMSLQEGYQELTQEQVERLQIELNIIKANTRKKNMEGISHNQSAPMNSSQFICQSHLLTALKNTRPSISQQEWHNFIELYDGFQKSRDTKRQSGVIIKAGQRVTLA
ncbi:peroxisome biogenesis factor 1 isoform X2 [Carcharodon carcharias]|uniref:peroxisome biogenesis factor 1 isoform X2 n=1 Tax=Carcharodon carcharias TaxID=13397 RepID=UPI001B7F5A69|nr:peroxisome biogenesis factor 1 isoform X2 [Carcharodon carcharias]